MKHEHGRQQQEYRAMKAWLAGEKPPTQGRSWRRAVVAALPPAARAVGQQTRLDATFVLRLVLVPLALPVLLLLPGEQLVPDGPFFHGLFSWVSSLAWYGGLIVTGLTLLTGGLALLCQGDR
jgi:hypothetical protein